MAQIVSRDILWPVQNLTELENVHEFQANVHFPMSKRRLQGTRMISPKEYLQLSPKEKVSVKRLITVLKRAEYNLDIMNRKKTRRWKMIKR